MSPIHIHTASISRGRGCGRGTSREQPESSRAHGTSPYESDPEEDPAQDSYTAPPSPESPRHQYGQFPGYGTQYPAQPAPRAPSIPDRPDYPKTVMLMKNLGTPSFAGSTNPIDADHWRETLDRNFAAIRCPPEYKKDIAVYYLQRDAGSWWQTVERSHDLGVLDYETFCREFERKYFPPEARDRLEIQYLDLTQGRGTVRDYEAEFTRLRRYAARAQQEDEASVIRRFIRGLRPQIRTHMQVVRQHHLSEVVEKAVNIEESLAAEQTAMARTAAPRQTPRLLGRLHPQRDQHIKDEVRIHQVHEVTHGAPSATACIPDPATYPHWLAMSAATLGTMPEIALEHMEPHQPRPSPSIVILVGSRATTLHHALSDDLLTRPIVNKDLRPLGRLDPSYPHHQQNGPRQRPAYMP